LLFVPRENRAVLAEAPRARAHLEDRRRRLSSMKNLGLRDAVGRPDHPAKVVVDEGPRAQLAVVDLRLAAQHALDQLRPAHLEAEEQHRVQDRLLLLGQAAGAAPAARRRSGQVQHERRLAHRRARRDDHQVARLHPAGHLVEVGEVVGDPGDRVLSLRPLGDRRRRSA
jgi:hypothetical protein